MPQVHTYLRKEVYEALRRQAEARGMSLSAYLRELLERHVLPHREEFYALAGSWEGELERPPQGEPEVREGLL
ncbi:hypothetical protein [Thermus tengchongensis]|uniref:Ribbon-helix-helix protein, CopG family n=1 Tax=Thermus tengchongensis TaxID=1214928 RepID=A0ABY2K7H7_9DEIN|nr:hypothetical protein [Thermus tengchongensis]TFU17005.1 hypothetical protein E0489_03090 [Thermus tengchongensis]